MVMSCCKTKLIYCFISDPKYKMIKCIFLNALNNSSCNKRNSRLYFLIVMYSVLFGHLFVNFLNNGSVYFEQPKSSKRLMVGEDMADTVYVDTCCHVNPTHPPPPPNFLDSNRTYCKLIKILLAGNGTCMAQNTVTYSVFRTV